MKDSSKALVSKESCKKIFALKSPNERLTKKEEIEREFVSHYIMVFQCHDLMEKCRVAMQTCLNIVLHHLSKDQTRMRTQSLTLNELTPTLMVMVEDKSPGLDDFLHEYYKAT